MPFKSRLKPEPVFEPKPAISEACLRTGPAVEGAELASVLPTLPEPTALEFGQLRQTVRVKALNQKKGEAKDGSGLRKLLCLPPARSQGLDEAWIRLATSWGCRTMSQAIKWP